MVNRHINPTNICRNRCKFCAFARNAGEEGAYEMTLDEVAEAAAEGAADGAYEIHIVSGLHPDWSYEFYVDMVRAHARGRARPRDRPGVHRRRDRAHGDHQRQADARGARATCKDAGLDALPGGGAEIFSRPHAHGRVGQEDEVRRVAAHPRRGALARHRDQLHDALRPHRDARGARRPPRSACASSRTRPAASSPSSRSRSTRPTPSSPTCRRPPASTTSRRSRSRG